MPQSKPPDGHVSRRIVLSNEANGNLDELSETSGIQADEIVSLMLENHPEVLNETIAVFLEEKAAIFRAMANG